MLESQIAIVWNFPFSFTVKWISWCNVRNPWSSVCRFVSVILMKNGMTKLRVIACTEPEWNYNYYYFRITSLDNALQNVPTRWSKLDHERNLYVKIIFLFFSNTAKLHANQQHRNHFTQISNDPSAPLVVSKADVCSSSSPTCSSGSDFCPSSDLLDTDILLFLGLHPQLETYCTVCSADHPAHPLWVVWPSWRLACRCDLIHQLITSQFPIFLKFKNVTSWKKTVSKLIFILSLKLIIIKFDELHELFQVSFCCRLVIGMEDPWGRGEAV